MRRDFRRLTCAPVCLLAAALLLTMPALRGQPAPRTYPAAKQGGNYMHNYYLAPAHGSTPWAPAWSPDGVAIAVAMRGSIWKVDPASGAAEELPSPRSESQPDESGIDTMEAARPWHPAP